MLTQTTIVSTWSSDPIFDHGCDLYCLCSSEWTGVCVRKAGTQHLFDIWIGIRVTSAQWTQWRRLSRDNFTRLRVIARMKWSNLVTCASQTACIHWDDKIVGFFLSPARTEHPFEWSKDNEIQSMSLSIRMWAAFIYFTSTVRYFASFFFVAFASAIGRANSKLETFRNRERK